MAGLRIKRGTRAQLNAAAAASQLVAGEPYLITDEGRIAIGLTASTYQAYSKEGEGGGGSAPEMARCVVSTASIYNNNGWNTYPISSLLLNDGVVSQSGNTLTLLAAGNYIVTTYARNGSAAVNCTMDVQLNGVSMPRVHRNESDYSTFSMTMFRGAAGDTLVARLYAEYPRTWLAQVHGIIIART